MSESFIFFDKVLYRTKLCGYQSDKEYLLFEGVTNIKNAILSHNSLIKERCDLSAKASGSCDGTRQL